MWNQCLVVDEDDGSIRVAGRSKPWVCGCLLAGILGSNPTLGHGCLFIECCVLSGRGLCVGLITRPEEFYRVWCIGVCEALIMSRPWPIAGWLLHHGAGGRGKCDDAL